MSADRRPDAADRIRAPWLKPAILRMRAGSAEVRAKPGAGTDGGSFS